MNTLCQSMIAWIAFVLLLTSCGPNEQAQQEMADLSNKLKTYEQSELLEQKNIAAIKGILNCFATGDTEKLDDFVHPDFLNHLAPEGMQDREGFHEIVRSVGGSFDSFRVDAFIIFAKGDKVAMLDKAYGEKNGHQYGDHLDFHIFRMEDGKMREHWNSFGLSSQRDKMMAFLGSAN